MRQAGRLRHDSYAASLRIRLEIAQTHARIGPEPGDNDRQNDGLALESRWGTLRGAWLAPSVYRRHFHAFATRGAGKFGSSGPSRCCAGPHRAAADTLELDRVLHRWTHRRCFGDHQFFGSIWFVDIWGQS